MKLGAPKELVHRKLALWQQHGVLREEAGGRYYVVETGSSKEKMERGAMLIDSDEERDSNTTTQSEQREEKLQVPTTHKHTTVNRIKDGCASRSNLKHCGLCFCSCSGPTSRQCWQTWTAWRWNESTQCSGCSLPRDLLSRRWMSMSWRPSCRGRSGNISCWSPQASTDSPNLTDRGVWRGINCWSEMLPSFNVKEVQKYTIK